MKDLIFLNLRLANGTLHPYDLLVQQRGSKVVLKAFHENIGRYSDI